MHIIIDKAFIPKTIISTFLLIIFNNSKCACNSSSLVRLKYFKVCEKSTALFIASAVFFLHNTRITPRLNRILCFHRINLFVPPSSSNKHPPKISASSNAPCKVRLLLSTPQTITKCVQIITFSRIHLTGAIL